VRRLSHRCLSGPRADSRNLRPAMARIGVLTGGGDCPGLNAVIRAVVRKGVNHYGQAIVGYEDGWRGVLENRVMYLTPDNTSGILHRGGTILGSSRTNPFSSSSAS
jgi:ATP-dependent phosphofructokinase / diphosphate-dependent phosphofructokinase